jgi:hypothetical protein
MQKLIKQDGLFTDVKRGLAIALIAVLLAIVVALSLWYALQPNLPADIIAECSRDPQYNRDCIAREERLRDECAGKTGQDLHDCAADIIYKEFDEPALTVTTGPLTE